MTRFRHLKLTGGVRAEEYSYPREVRGAGRFKLPPRDDELAHARSLRNQLAAALQQATPGMPPNQQASGITLVFESEPEFLLRSESLEDRRAQIRLLSVKPEGTRQLANVFVPRDAFAKFLRKIDDYENEQKRSPKSHQRRNKKLIDSIAGVRLAIARDLWTDARPFPAVEEAIWWEVWIRDEERKPREVHAAFQARAQASGLRTSPQRLEFPERVVTLIQAAPAEWDHSGLLLSEIAELRYPAEPATPYLDLSPADQAEAMADAVRRLRAAAPDAPAVCLLDTGVRRAHPLLEASLLEQDLHAVDPEWGTADHDRGLHGTCMAGNALHGCLTELFQTRDTVILTHRLESVKILPPRGATRPELYGETVQQATARAEIARADRERVLCMAITDTNAPVQDGRPTSWSAGIDQMTWNDGGSTRILCVSAGNIRDLDGRTYSYPSSNLGAKAVVEDPAQSWNALTVGAYAGRHQVSSDKYAGWTAAAPFGGLTPTSRTTANWLESPAKAWPYKPDIVMDGGNWARDGTGLLSPIDDLALLTTGFGSSGPKLDTNGDTSAATALAARACAVIQASYPNLRAETIRALLVHSARWTPQMEIDCPGIGRADLARRLRTFGYGVPNLPRTLWSLQNEVTLVAEGAVTPYIMTTDGPKTNQMAVHGLPWPSAVLMDLGETPVTLRVTLSYYIEPSPGFRGWTKSFRYASHGLRFELRQPGEDERRFLARLSKEAQDEDTGTPNRGSDPGWTLGWDRRVRGSLHVDWWTGTARELAQRDMLAIYPVTGWWRERPHLGRVETPAPYALCLSIETPDQAVDLYTPIVTQTAIVTPIEA